MDTQCIKMFRVKRVLFKNSNHIIIFLIHNFYNKQKMKMKYNKLAVKVKDSNKNSKVKLFLILEFI